MRNNTQQTPAGAGSIPRVLVLYGGTSNEREVSLRSGAQVANYVRRAGYPVTLADTAAAGFDLAAVRAKADVVLPMLHGAGGEDGAVQRRLDALDVRYCGSGAAACALTLDKVKTKELLAENGILTPKWAVVNRVQFEASGLRRRSFVLKPIAGGSTIDTLIAHNPSHQPPDPALIDKLFDRYKHMLLEELVEGREVTVGILGDKPLPVILIVPPPGEEFDYENKYNGRSQEIVRPAELPPAVQARAQQLAKRVHRLTGCRDLSRTDIILAEDGSMYVLEINTLPGMTGESLVPKAAAAAGIDMTGLVRQLVAMAAAR